MSLPLPTLDSAAKSLGHWNPQGNPLHTSWHLVPRLIMLALIIATLSAVDQRRPNIVFVLVDDMGFRDIACNGSRFYETPQIDRLASQGMRFTDSYAACPVCSPTRLSILTGKYPARVQLTNYIAGNRWPDNSPIKPIAWTPYMPPDEVTIAETLASVGYVTACIGKWHLNARGNDATLASKTQPAEQGFTQVIGRVPNQNDKSASGMTDRAIEFMTANKDRPFFVYLCHHSVHIPLEATPELIEKYQRRIAPGDPQNNPSYGGMVETVDRSVGRIMGALDDLGLAEDTMLVFYSDNGGLSVKEGANTPATSNLPFRNGKGFLHEGGIRVPLIVRWPRVVPVGSTCAVPITSVDFFPTILAATGVKTPLDGLDGESLMPLLTRTGGLERSAIFWHYPHYSNQGGVPSGAIREGAFKLIESYEDGRLELYDLNNDPGELKDLAAIMPERVAAMHRILDEWRAGLRVRMPVKNLAYDMARPRYSDPAKAPESWRADGEPTPPRIR